MEVVEHIFEVSTKLESILQFYDFCEDIHKTAKCSEENCSFAIYINSLTDVLDPEKNYFFQVNLPIKKSAEHYNAFGAMFQVHKLGKEKVKVHFEDKK